MMNLATIRFELQQELSTLTLTNPEPEVKQSRPHSQSQWAKMYVALSLGLENLLSYDRDREIAVLALKRGAESESVSEIIAQSPVDWTRDEAKVIASLAAEHLEQERERLQQKQSQLELERELRQLEREQLRQQQKPERNQDWGIEL